jgi:hypothetical protein
VLLLVGKDGRFKLPSDTPMQPKRSYGMIDEMPRRRGLRQDASASSCGNEVFWRKQAGARTGILDSNRSSACPGEIA